MLPEANSKRMSAVPLLVIVVAPLNVLFPFVRKYPVPLLTIVVVLLNVLFPNPVLFPASVFSR